MALLIVALCMALAGIFYARMRARAESDRQDPDAGLAILDFGRAFPDEAIRAIHATQDGKAFFVRLHDGKAGVMASHGAHFACHLISAGGASVTGAPSGNALAIHFADFRYLDGTYAFPSEQVAAEVSLWLLGSFHPKSEFGPLPAN